MRVWITNLRPQLESSSESLHDDEEEEEDLNESEAQFEIGRSD